jgi:hypothetical protein
MWKTLIFSFFLMLPWVTNANLKNAFEVYTTTPVTTFDGRYMQGVVGASFHARNPNLFDRQIYSVQLPEWNAGCGGIDIFSGSFSLITKDEIVQIARGIAQGAPGYFFNLAIDSVCPSCGANMKELSDRLNSYNAMASDSCNQAWDTFSDVTELTTKAEQLKSHMETVVPQDKWLAGLIPDYGTHMADRSNQNAGAGSLPDSATSADIAYMLNNAIFELFKGSTPGTYTDIVGLGLKPHEMFMSFIGGAIVTDTSTSPTQPEPTFTKPAASIDLKDFIFGPEGTPKQITLTKCASTGDPQCLEPIEDTVTWDGLIPMFKDLIWNPSNTGIIQIIHQRGSLSVTQQKFITTYPYPYVTWANKCFVGASPQIANFVGTAIALQSFDQFLLQMETDASKSMASDGLKPELYFKPAEINEIISNKRNEMMRLRDNMHKQVELAQKELHLQVSMSIESGLCERI